MVPLLLLLLLALCATGAYSAACDCSTTPGAVCTNVSDAYTNLTWSCVRQFDPSLPTPWMRMLLNGASSNKSDYSNHTLYANDAPMLTNQGAGAPDMVYAGSLLQGSDPTQYSAHVMDYVQLNIGGDVGVVNGFLSSQDQLEAGFDSLHLTNPQVFNYTGSIWFKLDFNTMAYGQEAWAYIADGWDVHFLPNATVGTVEYISTVNLTVHLADIYHAVWTVSTAQVCLYLKQYGAASGRLVNTTSQCTAYTNRNSLMQDGANSQLGGGYVGQDYNGNPFDFNITTWDMTFWTTVLNVSQVSSMYLTSLPTVAPTAINTTTTSDTATTTLAPSPDLWHQLQLYQWIIIISCGSVIVLGIAIGGCLAYRWRHRGAHYSRISKP